MSPPTPPPQHWQHRPSNVRANCPLQRVMSHPQEHGPARSHFSPSSKLLELLRPPWSSASPPLRLSASPLHSPAPAHGHTEPGPSSLEPIHRGCERAVFFPEAFPPGSALLPVNPFPPKSIVGHGCCLCPHPMSPVGGFCPLSPAVLLLCVLRKEPVC